MENTTTFQVPEGLLTEKKNPLDNLKPKKAKKETTEILDTRPRLPRTNRTISCIYCGQERILNPDQYQAYYDYWGDEEKVARNFDCKPCEVARNDNPFKFWFKHSEQTRVTLKTLKAIFEVFKNTRDVAYLQNMTTTLFAEKFFLKVDNFNANGKFMINYGLPQGVEISCVPYVGTVQFLPYEEQEKIKFI